MQDAMPEVMDVSNESSSTLELYGAASEPTQTFGQQCLLARRFAEAGVRFIEVTHGSWDQHTNLTADHKARAEACDKPIAGLLKDLKQRDMLKDTLVVWGESLVELLQLKVLMAGIIITRDTPLGWLVVA